MAKLKALVCDDEAPLRDLMARRLERMDLDVERAESGGDAARRLEQGRYDLLVTDIYMPDVTGLQLLQQMKALDAHAQVVVVTASATLDNAVQALNHGAFAYLTKPFDHLSVFDNVVSRAVDFRRAVLDNLRMGEVQRRRGDLLEQEITGRIRQVKRTQDFLEDLLACLPIGVAVFDGDGRLELANPRAETLLGADLADGDGRLRPILEALPEQGGQRRGEVELGGRRLEIGSIELEVGPGETRPVVVVRELEDGGPAAGDLVRETLLNLRRGLTWIARHQPDSDLQTIVRGMAQELAALAKLTGVALAGDEIVPPAGPIARKEPPPEPVDESEDLAPAVIPPPRRRPGNGKQDETAAARPPAPASSLMLRKGMTMVLEGRLRKKRSTAELARSPEDALRMQEQIERWARAGDDGDASGEPGAGPGPWPPALPSSAEE